MRVVNCTSDNAVPSFMTFTVECDTAAAAHDAYSRLLLVFNRGVVKDSQLKGSRLTFTVSDLEQVKRLLLDGGFVELSDQL